VKLFEAHETGTFIDRPNRFVMVIELPDGSHVRAHAPNPGRMWELLYPGTKVILQRPSRAAATGRKTSWSVVAVRRPSDGTVIPLVATAANEIAAELIIPQLFPEALCVHREVTRGPSRFDFQLELPDGPILMEVKSCTLEAHGVAMFPDAATERGRRHVEELTSIRDGRRVVLFVIQGPRADRFVPDIHTDPAFSQALKRAAENGVEIRVAAVESDPTGETHLTQTDVPIDWSPLTAVEQNSGAYVLHMRVDPGRTAQERQVEIGALGTHSLAPGHYLYVGSAMGTMTTRIARHLRVRKRMRWHVDYLRAVSDWAAVYPVYSTRRLECPLATALSSFLPQPFPGFGSSDCACKSHLFFSPGDPRRLPEFVETILLFRHREALTR